MSDAYNTNCLNMNNTQNIMGLIPIVNESKSKWEEPLNIKTLIQEFRDVISNISR